MNPLSLDTPELDTFVLQFVAPKHRKQESDLYQSKWFDYKLLHPVQACQVFMEAYDKVYRESVAARQDKGKAEGMRVLKAPFWQDLPARERTGIWKARRLADEYGMPYQDFCDLAFEYARKRNWEFLPQPMHLYSETRFEEDHTMVEYIVMKWLDRKEESAHISHAEFFRTDAFVGHPYQLQHFRHILKIIKDSSMAHISAAFYLQNRYIPEAILKNALPDGNRLFARAQQFFV
jgi:hypothetical protein